VTKSKKLRNYKKFFKKNRRQHEEKGNLKPQSFASNKVYNMSYDYASLNTYFKSQAMSLVLLELMG